MANISDFHEEAQGCLQLAETETHPDVKTLLMGMAMGWMTIANNTKVSPTGEIEHSQGGYGRDGAGFKSGNDR